jgi:hypothetical protein
MTLTIKKVRIAELSAPSTGTASQACPVTGIVGAPLPGCR